MVPSGKEYIFRWKKSHDEFLMDHHIWLRHGGRVKGVYRPRNRYIFRRGDKIRIKGEVYVEEYARMPAGSFCSVGAFSQPACYLPNGVKIGRYCSIAGGVKVMGGQHPLDRFTTSTLTYRNDFTHIAAIMGKEWQIKPYATCIGYPEIGNDVWIGDDAVLKGNIIIGDGAVIAANSVVTKNVPPYSIVAGVPAKVIKYRFPQDIISELIRLQWWNYRFVDLPDNQHCDDISYFIRNLSDDIERGNVSTAKYMTFNIGKSLNEL
ncbi:CatB-related O-acetyltransferase [Apirhabdus apintestini]|nr:CatB-related O-acetyltransferase [Enterobacteriaceae bacterium CA-0114]